MNRFPTGEELEDKPIKKPMTDSEILKKAIEKAKKNGYAPEYTARELIEEVTLTSDSEALAFNMIFSHDFAKAFWGEDLILTGEWYVDDFTPEIRGKRAMPKWQYHLQQMVISENPISYLKKFI